MDTGVNQVALAWCLALRSTRLAPGGGAVGGVDASRRHRPRPGRT